MKMEEPPSLISLCIDDLTKQLLFVDDAAYILQDIYDLPSHLLDELISRLSPLALHKFYIHMPFQDLNKEDFPHNDSPNNKRKRSREWDWDWDRDRNTAWQKLFELRWPKLINKIKPTDWQIAYWETHLQNCLDEAAEVALIRSFKGCIGDIQISDSILDYIGFKELPSHSKYSKLSYHCLQFGSFVSCLRLQNILCTSETTRLLRECKLQSLVLRCIRSKEQVDGVCKLITQHSRTLTSLEFIHCTLYTDFINAILDSVVIKGVQKHGIQHLSIVSSSLGQCSGSLPSGLVSFLSSARSLCSLKLFDSRLGRITAKALFETLLDVSCSISNLDLSENEIAGWLSHFNRRQSSGSHLSVGIGKSFKLLRVLNLRGNNLRKDDTENLGYALAYMPSLEDLDISDNPIGDEGIRNLIPYFVGTSEACSRVACLNLEACEMSYDGVNHLLDSLSTLKGSLKSLSIAENYLGSKVAEALGRFLSTPVEVLDASGIDLRPNGFQELQYMLKEDIKLVKLNISKNRGGIEAANFLSRLLSRAPQLTDVNAASNFMPIESLSIISCALKVAKGNVHRLDLTGHRWDYEPGAHASLCTQFAHNGKPILILPTPSATAVPVDHDP